MPQRLDRERQFCEAVRPSNTGGNTPGAAGTGGNKLNEHLKQNGSMELPGCLNDMLPA